ncbi:undecaprenyl-diphosphate phosphatase [Granulicella arctica]|uniref:Undecaprenyl-diphosphatase n=1 Tax=Granulicella arctica TaxID=940613 RepID=A0A7Y9PDK0_9BACT|nr:undecaprenyl-diphosphate phosphatase [Granulicella arctica]NYF77837.1 undecaprenyl-diphosphatase [Granulicella arctica]
MPIVQVIILAIVQGLAELLPVSSSAHVVVAEKLMGLDPSSPQMTLLLVMLHTGTMFAVIAYFWKQWRFTYFKNALTFKRFAIRVIWATALTGIIGEAVKKIIEITILKGVPHAEIEDLFGHLEWIAPALLAAGLLILLAGLMERRRMGDFKPVVGDSVTMRQAGWIGFIQGLCLPFRGFSRSGATISTGMLTGASKERAERFSFALAVILTPPVVAREAMRLVKATHASPTAAADLHAAFLTSLLGMVFAFLAGLVALKWLSSWLEEGRWYLFGIYCIVASGFVFYLHTAGY